MISPKDLTKPAAVALGLAAAAALGFAAGFIVARDPRLLRRLARAVAGGVERVSVAVAESREELSDLWAEVREDAQEDIEERTFAASDVAEAAGAAGAATEDTDAMADKVATDEALAEATPSRSRAPRRRSAAAKPTTH